MKRYMNAALVYSLLAMAGGVFYREFTKFSGFAGRTALSVVHTHYFMLGMVFFLLLLLLEKSFAFTGPKTGRVLAVYHAGLNLTAVMLLARGVFQVRGTALSAGADAALSGMAGITGVQLEEKEDGLVSARVKTDSSDIYALSRRLFFAFADRKQALLELSLKKASLEDIFIELTEGGDPGRPYTAEQDPPEQPPQAPPRQEDSAAGTESEADQV